MILAMIKHLRMQMVRIFFFFDVNLEKIISIGCIFDITWLNPNVFLDDWLNIIF